MSLSRFLYLASRAARDAEVGVRSPVALGRRLIRRQVQRRVIAPVENRAWRTVWRLLGTGAAR